jgi:hypothetical protein
MMKQILNEWKRFVIKEVNQPFIDQELGADFGGRWFGTFDDYLGVIQGMPFYGEWTSYLQSKYPSLQQDLMQKAKTDKEAQIAYKKIFGGHSYYVDRMLTDEDLDKLYEIKVKGYIENAPKDQVEFFLANMERILEYGDTSRAPHNIAPTTVAFYGRPTDWFMFGDGYEKAKQAFSYAKANYGDLEGLPSETQPEEPTEATPEEAEAFQSGNERAAGMADMFSRFFADNPPEPKRRRRK